MMKKLITTCVLSMVAGAVLAQSPTPANEVVRFKGTNSNYVSILKNGTIYTTGASGASGAIAATTLTASGATTLSGSFTVIGGGVTSRWDNGSSLIDATKLAGNIAVARITTALTTPGPIGASTPGAGTFTSLAAGQGVTFSDAGSTARTFTQSDDYKMVIQPNNLGTITNGQSLGAVSTWYKISAAGAITAAVANASAMGQVFNVINTGTNAITFSDAGNLALSSDAVLGQYDTLSLYSYDGTNWAETAQQDN